MKPEEAIKIIRVAKAECEWSAPLEYQAAFDAAIDALEKQIPKPSAQPEIVRCRECKHASGDSRICQKSGYSPIGELDFCAWAEQKENR